MSKLSGRGRGRYVCLAGDFHRSEKMARLSDSACAAYVRALSYCADTMTDGRVPKVFLANFLRKKSALSELVDDSKGSPCWIDRGDHFEIYGYLEMNTSRAETEAIRERQRAIAVSRWNTNGDATGTTKPDATGTTTGTTKTIPARALTQDSGLRTQDSEERERTRAHVGPEQTETLVRRGFARRFERARGMPPGGKALQGKALSSVVAWCDSHAKASEKPVAEVVVKLLDQFFADKAFAPSTGFSMAALAADPPQYFDPPPMAARSTKPEPEPATPIQAERKRLDRALDEARQRLDEVGEQRIKAELAALSMRAGGTR